LIEFRIKIVYCSTYEYIQRHMYDPPRITFIMTWKLIWTKNHAECNSQMFCVT